VLILEEDFECELWISYSGQDWCALRKLRVLIHVKDFEFELWTNYSGEDWWALQFYRFWNIGEPTSVVDLLLSSSQKGMKWNGMEWMAWLTCCCATAEKGWNEMEWRGMEWNGAVDLLLSYSWKGMKWNGSSLSITEVFGDWLAWIRLVMADKAWSCVCGAVCHMPLLCAQFDTRLSNKVIKTLWSKQVLDCRTQFSGAFAFSPLSV